MKHSLKLFLIILCCFSNVKASDIYKEGYILSLKGDTTKGFLLVQGAKDASEKCIFKQTTDGKLSTFNPNEITGYRYLDSKYFISKEINIDSLTKKVVFLEFLIKGTANIYYYVDNNGEHYYIEKLPEGFMELTEKERTSIENGHNYIRPSKFRGKLSYMLHDCPGITNEIQNTTLSHRSLIKLTKDYHEMVCKSANCIIYERNIHPVKTQFGIIAGFSLNKYNFGKLLISDFQKTFQIGVGVKVSNFFLSNEHFSLNVFLLLEKEAKSYTLNVQEFNSYISWVNNNNTLTYLGDFKNGIQADLNVTDLKIPISLNYNFNITPKTIYTIGIGYSNKIILSQNNSYQIKDLVSTYKVAVNSLIGGPLVKTGIEGNWFGKHSVFINAVYEYLFSYDSSKSIPLNNYQLSIQAGIYF